MICKTALEDEYPKPSNPVLGPRIKCSRATELVLKAAKEYFNSSSDLSDKVMDLARECLNLIEDHTPELQAEFDLMAALALLHEFGISILPLQGILLLESMTSTTVHPKCSHWSVTLRIIA